MKKSTKRFVISTESKNNKGFRVRTSGIQLLEYEQNPIMLWMHKRPKGESKDEILPIGFFTDLAFEGGQLMGTPVFDDTDDFAMKIYKKVENGTLKMASAGLVPLKWSKVDSDTWLEKSKLKEISLVDIGSNADALAVALCDENGSYITLSLDQIHENLKTKTDMKTIKLNAEELLVTLSLSENATDAEAQTAIENLVTLAADQKTQIDALKSEKKAAEDTAADYKEKYEAEVQLSNDQKIEALVQGAVDSKKITADQKEGFVSLASADFDGTKAVLEGMPENPDVMQNLGGGNSDNELVKLSWEELDKRDLLVKLKAENLTVFKEKFKEAHGTEYKED